MVEYIPADEARRRMNASVLASVQRITAAGKCITDPTWNDPFVYKSMVYDPTADRRGDLHGRMVKSELLAKGWKTFGIEGKQTGAPRVSEFLTTISKAKTFLCPPGKTPVLPAGQTAKVKSTALPLFRPTEFGNIYEKRQDWSHMLDLMAGQVANPPIAVSTIKPNHVPVTRWTGGSRRSTDWTSAVEQALINSQCILDPSWKGPGMHTMQFTPTDSKNLNARGLLEKAGWKTHNIQGQPWMCPPDRIPFFEAIPQTPDEAGPATTDEVVVVGPDTIAPATLLEEEETVSEEEVKKAIKEKDEEEANYLPHIIGGGVLAVLVTGVIIYMVVKK